MTNPHSRLQIVRKATGSADLGHIHIVVLVVAKSIEEFATVFTGSLVPDWAASVYSSQSAASRSTNHSRIVPR